MKGNTQVSPPYPSEGCGLFGRRGLGILVNILILNARDREARECEWASGRESTWGSPTLLQCKPQAMAMEQQESWEYEKLISSSHKLRIAFQDQLTSLSEDLCADGMISNDNKTEVLNQSTPLPNRASKLVDLVTNRVKVMREDYRTFVTLLKRNQRTYKPILVIRKFVYLVV